MYYVDTMLHVFIGSDDGYHAAWLELVDSLSDGRNRFYASADDEVHLPLRGVFLVWCSPMSPRCDLP